MNQNISKIKLLKYLIGLTVILGAGNLAAQEESDSLRIIEYLNKGELLCHSIPDSACIYYGKAISEARSLGNKNLLVKGLYGLGKSNYVISDYKAAFDSFEEGLKISTSQNNLQGIIYGLNGCGIALTMLKQESEAIKKHKQAIPLCLEIKEYSQLAKNLFNISISFDGLKMIDSSIYYIDSALNLSEVHDDFNTICKYKNHKAELHLLNEEYEEAEQIFLENLSTEGFDNQWEVQFCKAGLAKAYMHLGKLDESLELGLDAYRMAKSINSKWDLQEVAKSLSNIYEKRGDFEEALIYTRIHKAYSDSLYNEDKEREINAHFLYEERLNNQILSTENELFEKQLAKRKSLIIIFVIFLIISLIATLMILRLYQTKAKLLNELKELNATKDKLFKIIAHDLKSPIGIMIQFTDLLQENLETYDNETIQKFLSLLNKSSKGGVELLDNLLSWARSQTGDIPFEPREINIQELVNSTIALLSTQVEMKQIQITLQLNPEETVVADEGIMQIIIRNLVSNALKFSHPGGQIIVSTDSNAKFVTFYIRDFGTGIPIEKHEKLFEIGNRLNLPGTANEKGTGLGLLICKDLVERHGGRIWIDPEITEGAQFCFVIPNHK